LGAGVAGNPVLQFATAGGAGGAGGRCYIAGALMPRPRIQLVRQVARQDCGAACLAMTLAWHGRAASLPELRAELGAGRDGTSAFSLKALAERHGLACSAVAVEGEALERLPPGSILHWEKRHFVVFERWRGGRAHVVDPAVGRLQLDRPAFEQAFAGVALMFTPAGAAPGDAEPVAGPPRWLALIADRKWAWLKVALAALAVRALGLGAIAALAVAVVDRAGTGRDLPSLHVAALAAGVALLLGALLDVVGRVLTARLRVDVGNRLRVEFLERLLRLPQSFLDQRSPGDLLARLERVGEVEQALASRMVTALADGLVAVACLAVMALADGALALALALVLTLALVAGWRARRLQEDAGVGACDLGKQQSLLITGLDSLKANGLERRALRGWMSRFVARRLAEMGRAPRLALLEATGDLLQRSGPILVLLYGTALVTRGQLTAGVLVALVVLGVQVAHLPGSLLSALAELAALRGRLLLLEDVLAAPCPEAAPPSSGPPLARGAGARVRVECVRFRHSPAGQDIIRSLSLTIEPGELVAIVGRSGAGKSTLVRLLAGLYQASEGELSIDGVSVRALAGTPGRARLAVLGPVPFLFGGTVMDNLTLRGPGVSRERVVSACRAAQLHDEIMAMPLGYQTRMGDGGLGLSTGQAQRLALAQALLREPRALILDDALSSQDGEMELRIFQALAVLSCTCVVVSHRLSTVAGADRILVLEQGRIVEQGTHEQLLARGTHYRALVGRESSALARPPARDQGGGRR
jgi:ATP-binding cassette, subfamily B, bacterial